MKRLLIATENQGKMRELQALLSDLPLALLTPSQVGLSLQVEETGQTYAENAALKAVAYARAANLPALADDSGLEVAALGGAPGLYSARYSPKPGATDADRRAYLLENLSGKPRPWRARFCATIAVTLPGGDVQFAEGFCAGEIIPEERGTDGFGYDPIFLLDELGRTMAELGLDEKNRLSHRARAVIQSREILRAIFAF